MIRGGSTTMATPDKWSACSRVARAVHEAAMKIVTIVLAAAVALQPTFSTRVEGVRVDVLVTDSSRGRCAG